LSRLTENLTQIIDKDFQELESQHLPGRGITSGTHWE
jgi:hypothetical protein